MSFRLLLSSLLVPAGILAVAPPVPFSGAHSPQDDPAETEAREPELFPVFLGVRVDEPVHGSLEGSMEGVVHLTNDGATSEREFESEIEVSFVDRLSTLDLDGWTGSRTYLAWLESEDGVAVDRELNGVRADYVNADGRVEVVVPVGIVSEATLQYLLNQDEAFGMWMPMPDEVALGEEFETDPSPLVHLLLSVDGELTESTARLALESVDESGLGTVRGLVSATVVEEENLLTSYEGEWVMEIDTTLNKLMSLRWEGSSTAQLRVAGLSVEGEASFELELTTTYGSAAERATRRKPEYRDVPRTLDELGLTLSLPSHWVDVGGGEFQSGVHGEDLVATLEFKAYHHSHPSTREGVREAMDSVEAEIPEIKPKSVSSGLGKGMGGTFTREGVDFLVEIFPLGARQVVRVRLYGLEEVMKKEVKAWSRVRKSLDVREGLGS